MVYRALALLAVMSLCACSTVLERSTQQVRVETPGASGAVCYLIRPGYSQKVYPPQTVRLTKSGDDMTVACAAPGNREKSVTVAAHVSDMAYLNVANGVVPGMLWDHQSGALHNYPELVSVDFTDIPASPQPLPAYQRLLIDYPDLANVEEFRPGTSALQSDRYEAVPTLQPAHRESALIEQSKELSDVSGGSLTVQGIDVSPVQLAP